jgi:hypothetical protein
VKSKHPFASFPYFIQYEITRFSLAIGVSLDDCSEVIPDIAGYFGDEFCDPELTRDRFMDTILDFTEALKERIPFGIEYAQAPLEIADQIWDRLSTNEGWPAELDLSAVALLSETSDEVDFNLRLQPLSISGKSSRFSHRFGSDRLLQVRLPTISRSLMDNLPPPLHKQNLTQEDLRKQTVDWLVNTRLELFNRRWRCFYVKDESKKKKDKDSGTSKTEGFLVAFFFAETGAGIGHNVEREREQLGLSGTRGLAIPGETEEERKDRLRKAPITREMTRDDLICWHMPVDVLIDRMAGTNDFETRGGMFAKMWSRITLGNCLFSLPLVT